MAAEVGTLTAEVDVAVGDNMARQDMERAVHTEPTQPGFYYNDGAAQVMIYLLDRTSQWWAIVDNGTMDRCAWSYIEQTTSAYPLRMVGA